MSDRVLSLLEETGAILRGYHFVGTKGRHMADYVDIRQIMRWDEIVYELCALIAKQFIGEVSIVIGPGPTGVKMSYHAVKFLRKYGQLALATSAERSSGDELELKNPMLAERLASSRVLLIDDTLHTGGTLAELRDLVRNLGGQVIGAGVICNRGDITPRQLGVPRIVSLADIQLGSYEAQRCPLCLGETPIVTNIGHGDEFQELNPFYTGGYVEI